MRDANMLIRNFDKSKTAQLLAKMSAANCDVSKVYKIEFSCNKLLKFLYTTNGEIVEVELSYNYEYYLIRSECFIGTLFCIFGCENTFMVL